MEADAAAGEALWSPLTPTEDEAESPEPPNPTGTFATPARRDRPVPPSVPKRRRLSRKTRPAEEHHLIQEAETPQEDLPAVLENDDAESDDEVFADAGRRKLLLNNYAHWWRKKENYYKLKPAQRRMASAKYNLRSLHPKVCEKNFNDWAKARPDLADDIDFLRKAILQRYELGTGQLLRKDTVLCTWNGDWGVVAEGDEADAWSSPVPTSESLGSSPVPTDAARFPTQVEPWADAMGIWRRDPEHENKLERKLAVRLQSHEKVLLIKEKFVAFVREWAEKRRCARYAWAVEVCGRTFVSSGNIRFHTHACFDFGKKVKIQIQSLLFEGTLRHVSDSIGALSFSRSRNRSAGLYYLQAPKVSSMFSGGSHEPFSDYGVASGNIFQMLQGHKLLYADARVEMTKVPLGIVRNLEALERWYREQCMQKQISFQAWHRQQLTDVRRPWRHLPLVELWREQYKHTQSRYKFLVLDGPSRMGKTEYARALCREGGLLELNMAGGAQADLREFDPLLHEMLLFDECTPQQVLQNKKLFQAGASLVQMGTSTTNMYAFAVYVAGIKFVVSSNVWSQEFRRLTVADAEWISQNSILVQVDCPLWIAVPESFLPCGDGT